MNELERRSLQSQLAHLKSLRETELRDAERDYGEVMACRKKRKQYNADLDAVAEPSKKVTKQSDEQYLETVIKVKTAPLVDLKQIEARLTHSELTKDIAEIERQLEGKQPPLPPMPDDAVGYICDLMDGKDTTPAPTSSPCTLVDRLNELAKKFAI
jgi:hypothetical protein